MNKTSVQTRNRVELKELNADFAKLVEKLLKGLWAVYEPMGYYPLITDGNRTLADQEKLYAQGRKTPGTIVTCTLNSNHIGGRAVDVGFVNIETGYLNYMIDYELMGEVVRDIPGLDWGFDLWGVDKPHVQFNPDEASKVTLEKGHWSDAAMRWMKSEKIITKDKEPTTNITWGEFAVVTQRMYNLLLKNLSND